MSAPNLKRFIRFLCVAVGVCLFSGHPAEAYVLLTDESGIYVVAWPPGTVSMNLKMPAPGATLTDGTNYNTSVQAGMQAWNGLLGTLQISSQIQAEGKATNGNGINEIVMDNTVGGTAFGTNTLAVTLSYSQGDVRVESDIVFNTAYTWDSYRGPRNGRTAIDIRRVAIHELGHVLGLDHPDEASPPQSVNAIMNSKVSNIDTMQADDIAGAQSLYGSPGFVPANNNFANAATISFSGTSTQITGTNVAATKETGEPNHAGDVGGRSVWWKWTPTSSGSATITTLGSNFDTLLGIYTGSSVSSLTQVAANDDVEPPTSSNSSNPNRIRTSTATFSVTSGTTYFIAVDGWNGEAASIVLNLSLASSGGTPPSITVQPSNQTATPGGSVSFTVTAGNNPATYQWSFGGTPISGATSATYTLNNVQSSNAGNYQVVVGNSSGSTTSGAATLTVLAGSLINETVTTGHDVAFSASNANEIQWQVSTDGGATWTNLTNNSTYRGVTTNTLEITGATSALNGQRYRYVDTSTGGSATSNAAILTVAQAFFPFPVGIAIDGSANLYVVDTSADTVQKVTSAGSVTTFAGTAGQTGTTDGSGTAARFNDPSGIISASDGTLSVTDNANATIRRITTAGAVTTLAGSTTARGNVDSTGSAATFSSPIGIGRDSSDNLYIADSTNNTIRKVTSAGVVTTLAGTAGATASTDGIGAAARFNHPTGLAVDSAGNVYVSDSINNTIRKITSTGTVTTLAGVAGVMGSADGTGPGALFNNPGGLSVDGSGNVYVADTGNSCVRQISPAGVVRLIAGLPGVAGLKDGSGSEAWFNQPRDLVVDSSGVLYVADTGNATIRKVTQAGAVTTVSVSQGTTPPPTPTPTPTPTPAPTPAPSSGGGGGAMNGWIAIALASGCLVRWSLKKK